jgi:FKBP-type peptidyl-prolyl cis-trans isomerase
MMTADSMLPTRLARWLVLSITAAAVLSCASSGATSTIAGTTFSPELAVDTTTMQPIRGGGWYRDLRVGTGPEALRGQTIGVYYIGMFPDGREFEVTRTPEAPARIRIGTGQVIAGWDRGIPGMRVGGQRLLVLPPSLAYGAAGNARIPPNSVLVFLIELVEAR